MTAHRTGALLVICGLIVEGVSVLWFRPQTFLLMACVSAPLILAGCAITARALLSKKERTLP